MMGRNIKGLAATGALAVALPLVLGGAAPATAKTAGATMAGATTAASCKLASAKNVSAVTYADRLVRAWGSGNSAAANCYASPTTSKVLFTQATPGGIHWRRTTVEGAAGTIYVTYHDDARGGNLTLGVQNVGLRTVDGWHAVYTARFSGEPKAWDAVQWSDNLVRAWGRGDTTWMTYYATPAVVKDLTGIAAKGGSHWQRTATEGAAGTTYVTYRNTASKHTLTIGVSNVRLSTGDAHLAYTTQYR